MSSIYARLGFNSADPLTNSSVQDLSANVTVQLNMMPKMLNNWQTKDIAEANTSGYYVNPLAGTISNIISISNDMDSTANNLSGTTMNISHLISDTGNIANTIVSDTGPGFLYHTNKQSNVIPPDANMNEVHYETAMGYGKLMMYMVHQSDGVSNNSPIIGNFTSLYTGDTLNAQSELANTWVTTLKNSISRTSTGSPPTYTYSSNITLSQAQSMYNDFANLNSTMVTYRNQDNAFFNNSKAIVSDYNKATQFSNMGQTQESLVRNFVGSPKIISRLNDTANN
jgi:hypothetical protein